MVAYYWHSIVTTGTLGEAARVVSLGKETENYCDVTLGGDPGASFTKFA